MNVAIESALKNLLLAGIKQLRVDATLMIQSKIYPRPGGVTLQPCRSSTRLWRLLREVIKVGGTVVPLVVGFDSLIS